MGIQMNGTRTSLSQLSLSQASHLLLSVLYDQVNVRSSDVMKEEDEVDPHISLIDIILRKRKEYETAKKKNTSFSLSYVLSMAAECEYYAYIDNWLRTETCYQ